MIGVASKAEKDHIVETYSEDQPIEADPHMDKISEEEILGEETSEDEVIS